MAAFLRNITQQFQRSIGQPVDKYCEWIRQPKNWGGEPEILVLTEHFKVEAVVHTNNIYILQQILLILVLLPQWVPSIVYCFRLSGSLIQKVKI